MCACLVFVCFVVCHPPHAARNKDGMRTWVREASTALAVGVERNQCAGARSHLPTRGAAAAREEEPQRPPPTTVTGMGAAFASAADHIYMCVI